MKVGDRRCICGRHACQNNRRLHGVRHSTARHAPGRRLAALSPQKRAAVDRIDYLPSARVFLQSRSRFWLARGESGWQPPTTPWTFGTIRGISLAVAAYLAPTQSDAWRSRLRTRIQRIAGSSCSKRWSGYTREFAIITKGAPPIAGSPIPGVSEPRLSLRQANCRSCTGP